MARPLRTTSEKISDFKFSSYLISDVKFQCQPLIFKLQVSATPSSLHRMHVTSMLLAHRSKCMEGRYGGPQVPTGVVLVGGGWGACMAKRGVWVEKLETRAWNRELVWATYASPGRPRWLGGTPAAWLGLGDAGAAHRHGLGCDFGYDFSQLT